MFRFSKQDKENSIPENLKKYTKATQVYEKSGGERFGINETKQIYIRKPAKFQYKK